MRTQEKTYLIDCDIHNGIKNKGEEIKSRLPRYFQDRGLTLAGHLGHPNPHGVNRNDATPPSGGPAGSDPAYLAEHHLDAHGIDAGILTGSGILSIGIHPDTDYATAVASAYNDTMLETWLDAHPRFYGSILVAPQDPQAAAQEIRKLGNHPKMVQVIMSSASRTALGDRMFWPLFEAACEMELPVAVHPGAECCGIANPFTNGYAASYFEWHSNLSQNYMAQLSSLVCRGTLAQFPELKFVCIEGGIGWLPHLMWRLDKNWKALRATVPWLTKPPSEYIIEQVRFTTQPVEEAESKEDFLAMMRMAKADKVLMYSSDYPHWDFDDPHRAFPKMPEDLAERIFYKTALELYGKKIKL